ncbi:MAG TPA: hypothetical protein VGO47_11390 [Chlamydiales bacterium]|nr:hypothetical protein [Chlamydiales bacterium]
MLINVRVGLGWAIQPPASVYSTFNLSNVFPRRTETTQRTRSLGLETSQEQVSLPEKPMVVNITSSQMVSSDQTASESVGSNTFKGASVC